MKVMQISVNLDVTNVEHVQALEAFTRALGGLPYTQDLNQTQSFGKTVAMTNQLLEEAPKPSQSPEDIAKAERQARGKARKAKAEAEAKALEEEDDDMLGDEDEEEDEEDPIDVATLRELTASKSKQFRAEIKAKLVELGVANVTTIPENKFKEYHKFITSL